MKISYVYIVNISSSWGQKSTCNNLEEFPNNEMDRCKIFNYEAVLGAPERVNIPFLMHDTCLCQIDVKMTYN